MRPEILISLAGLASFGIPASISACSIIATPEALESRARSAAEARSHADVIVIGYLSKYMTKENKSNKEMPVQVYELVFPKKVLRGVTKKTYRITTGPRTSCDVNPPRNQLIQLYINKYKTGWAIVAYDWLSQ